MLNSKNNNTFLRVKTTHPFHLVNESSWPILVSFSLFNLVISFLYQANYYIWPSFLNFSINGMILNFLFLSTIVSRWFIDITIEATFEGHHTSYVQKGIYFGMVLFIISEIMFFFSFFWAFFHNSLSPSIFIGNIWPPSNFQEIDPFSLPLLNTLLLIMSGVTITYSHQALITKNRILAIDGLIWTLIFGITFLFLQLFEYSYSAFSINDGIYGSIFFILTGFHGLHVLIGCIFLLVSFLRLLYHHFNSDQHVGYEAGILYWHMVDVVWLFLFLFLYIWGGSILS